MSVTPSLRLTPLVTLLIGALSSAILSGCSQPPSAQTAAEPPYYTELGMHDVMALVLDPAADIIWGSAGAVITAEGEQDLAPTTDEGWDRVQQAAASVIESANLLLLPARAVDNSDWQEFSLGLVTMGNKAMVAAKTHDPDALFQAGADLYQVCVACHQQYDRDIAEDQPGAPQ